MATHKGKVDMKVVSTPKRTTLSEPNSHATPSRKRAWVTPTFEKVALKDALNGTGDFLPDDLITLVS